MFKNIFNEWTKAQTEVPMEQKEDYDPKKDHNMDPTSHVTKDKKTGMFCVYNMKGKKVAEFKTKPEADAYAKKNHDALMKKEGTPETLKVVGAPPGIKPGKKKEEVSVKEAMDPVDKKELKGKHKDRKDKDIDNDGDVDSSDRFLHKKRKAISKAMKKDKEGEVEMNPKMDKGNKAEQKESRIRTALKSVLSERSQTAGATKPETMDDKVKGKGAKDMMNEPKETDDTVTKGHDDVSKAGKVTKAAGQRNGGDQVRSGDQNIVNSVVKALKGMK
mgnify:CR=1 FL=1